MLRFTLRHSRRTWSMVVCLLLCYSYPGTAAASPIPRNECANPPPGTVFCEDFEGVSPLGNFEGGAGSELIADFGPSSDGLNKLVRFRAPAGQSGGASLIKKLTVAHDVLYARWYQKYETGFNFSALNHGGGLHVGDRWMIGASGNRPTGADFAGFYMQYQEDTRKLYAYSYYRGMYQDCSNPIGSCWGDSLPCVYGGGYCTKPEHLPPPSSPTFTAGQWHCVEQLVNAGTPTATGSGANGRLVFWLDGVQIIDYQNLWIRTTAVNMQVQSLYLALYHHDGTHSVVGELSDNVVLSTQRIGCGSAQVDQVPPNPPTNLRIQ